MTGTLIDVIDAALYGHAVRNRIAAALIAGDDTECGRIIREAVGAAIAAHHDDTPDATPEELAEAFRDVYAAQAEVDRAANAFWQLAEVQK
jgi:ABC-type hemin transport system substrate-binding protein